MNIALGYELGTGKQISIPLRHTAVTGQSQESGKTTTLEALITRSGLRAVCFVTKRGERSFSTGRAIMPYFRESAGWQFVESILEATMREGMKFNRSWVMKLCNAHHGKDGPAPAGLAEKLADGEPALDALRHSAGLKPDATRKHKPVRMPDYGWAKPQTLAGVAANVEIALLKAYGLNESVYTELREYLRIVIPQIKSLPKSNTVDLKPGVNVMHLDAYSLQMQGLIIRSVLEWIAEKESKTVTVIPEAWKMVPQGRSSPVLLACEDLIREGAANQNYIWLDSQDIAGVHKSILRQVAVWIMGVQREIHETVRALDHLPGGVNRPKLDEIRTLGKGQFFCTWNDEVRKVYVWPAWMTAEMACVVAMTGQRPPAPPAGITRSEDEMFRERAEKAEKQVADLKCQIATLTKELAEALKSQPARVGVGIALPSDGSLPPVSSAALAPTSDGGPPTNDQATTALARDVARIITSDPEFVASLTVLAAGRELSVLVKREVISLTDQNLRGKLAALIAEHFFDEARNGNTAFNELKRRGVKTAKPNVYRELDALAELGFVTKEVNGYQRVPGIKITKNEVST